jgi:hypothetical protein
MPGTGDLPGSWGVVANTNIGTLLEQAIAGVATVTIVDANYTLTAANGASDEARNTAISIISGVALTATRAVIVPNAVKQWTFINNTTGGQSILIRTAAGTGVTIPAGWCCTVICDGANLVGQITPFYHPATNTVGAVIAGTSGSFTSAVTMASNLTVSGVTTVVAPRTVGTGRPIVASDNTFGAWSWNGGGGYVQIDVSGTLYGINVFVSDVRHKQTIAPAKDPTLPLIRQIQFIDYRYKPQSFGVPSETSMPLQRGGVSAQQLRGIREEWVQELSDGTLQPNILLLLTNAMKAIQEQDERISALAAEVAVLRSGH